MGITQRYIGSPAAIVSVRVCTISMYQTEQTTIPLDFPMLMTRIATSTPTMRLGTVCGHDLLPFSDLRIQRLRRTDRQWAISNLFATFLVEPAQSMNACVHVWLDIIREPPSTIRSSIKPRKLCKMLFTVLLQHGTICPSYQGIY